MSGPRWQVAWNATFYSSGTVTANGNTGVIVVPTFTAVSGPLIVPICFHVVGSDMTVDETNDVKIDWFTDAAGAYTFGTTTFAQMTHLDMNPPILQWPGAVTFWDLNYTGATEPPNPSMIPLPPYHKITHTLGGTVKSMSYIIYMHYLLYS